MDNGVLFQTIHGPEIQLIDTSHMVQLLQITLDLLDIYSFWQPTELTSGRLKSWKLVKVMGMITTIKNRYLHS